MKRRMLIAMVAVLVLPFLMGFSRMETITEEAVDDYLARMEQAFNKRDSDSIAMLIAPDARIELEQASKESTERMSLSREEYRVALAGGLPKLEGYRYTVKKSNPARIAAGAQSAEVRVKVVESFVIDSKRVVNETDCKYQLVLKRGRIVAESIIAKGRAL